MCRNTFTKRCPFLSTGMDNTVTHYYGSNFFLRREVKKARSDQLASHVQPWWWWFLELWSLKLLKSPLTRRQWLMSQLWRMVLVWMIEWMICFLSLRPYNIVFCGYITAEAVMSLSWKPHLLFIP